MYKPRRLAIVAYGEVDDGAFPSLAAGATKTIYEELYIHAEKLSFREAQQTIDLSMPVGTKFRSYFDIIKMGLN